MKSDTTYGWHGYRAGISLYYHHWTQAQEFVRLIPAFLIYSILYAAYNAAFRMLHTVCNILYASYNMIIFAFDIPRIQKKDESLEISLTSGRSRKLIFFYQLKINVQALEIIE